MTKVEFWQSLTPEDQAFLRELSEVFGLKFESAKKL